MLPGRFGNSRLFPHCFLMINLVLMLSSTAFAQTLQSARDADRGSQYYVNSAAAGAATEKVLAQMTADFIAGGQTLVDSNLSLYSSWVPLASDNPYWTNFAFLNPQTGATNSISVAQTILTNHATTIVGLQGMNGFQSLYRISSYARQTNNANTNLTGGTELDVALYTVPIFEFAIFYNSLLEFTTAGALVIKGYVHANSNIHVGSANPLTFNYPVTTTGVITNPPWAGITDTNNYSGAVNYNGTPAPGHFTGQPALNLPMGTNGTAPTNMLQIIYPPPNGESINSALGQQRYYNKAGMVIMVTNNTFRPSNTVVTIKFQSPDASDVSPLIFTSGTPAWTNNNFYYWFSTTNKLYDYRQSQWMQLSQINVSNFTTWCRTNYNIYTNYGTNFPKFSSTAPLNIIYIGDWRTNNSNTNIAVRLMNGGSANFPAYGLTVATPDPLYVWGNYNTPIATNLNSNNVTGTYPTSFVCDALTILSTSWSDTYNASTSLGSRGAGSTTVNGAMITGVVYSTGPGGDGTTDFSGGVHNMPRLIEQWNAAKLTLNTSMINLFPSAIATQAFVWPAGGIVYGVPGTRQFYFNTNYSTAAGLPPGTPLVTLLQRTGQIMLNPSGNTP